MNRGARREPIFRDPDHCALLLEKLAEVVVRFGLEVHAYALMPNHFHLLVRSVRGTIPRPESGRAEAPLATWMKRAEVWLQEENEEN